MKLLHQLSSNSIHWFKKFFYPGKQQMQFRFRGSMPMSIWCENCPPLTESQVGEACLRVQRSFPMFCNISLFPNMRLKSRKKNVFLERFFNFLLWISYSGCQPKCVYVKRTLTKWDVCDHLLSFTGWQQEREVQSCSATTLDTWNPHTEPPPHEGTVEDAGVK